MLRLESEKVMCRKMEVIEEDLTEEASVEVVAEISEAGEATGTTLGVSEAVMILMDLQVECDAWRTIIEVMTMEPTETVMDPHV